MKLVFLRTVATKSTCYVKGREYDVEDIAFATEAIELGRAVTVDVALAEGLIEAPVVAKPSKAEAAVAAVGAKKKRAPRKRMTKVTGNPV